MSADYRVNHIERLFGNDPLRGAEYLGDLIPISILANQPDEAYVRARMAARLADRVLRSDSARKAAKARWGKV